MFMPAGDGPTQASYAFVTASTVSQRREQCQRSDDDRPLRAHAGALVMTWPHTGDDRKRKVPGSDITVEDHLRARNDSRSHPLDSPATSTATRPPASSPEHPRLAKLGRVLQSGIFQSATPAVSVLASHSSLLLPSSHGAGPTN